MSRPDEWGAAGERATPQPYLAPGGPLPNDFRDRVAMRDRIAEALWEADCGAVSYEWADVSEGGRSKWRRLATAAMRAMEESA